MQASQPKMGKLWVAMGNQTQSDHEITGPKGAVPASQPKTGKLWVAMGKQTQSDHEITGPGGLYADILAEDSEALGSHGELDAE